jgi:hypothetical protein
MSWVRRIKRADRATSDDRVACPVCAMTLPLAIFGPRHCPRCAAERDLLVTLQPFAADGGAVE